MPSSRTQHRYFITFIDDYSRYTVVFLIRQKSEALSVFKQFHKAAELQTGRRLKKLRSDNGGEYMSREFQNYCADQGIHHEHTIPYSPQQNGVAERKNRTLLNAVRCMLIHSGLSRVFWTEAILTAVFIQNHLPTTAPSGKIPIIAWTCEPLDVLLIFMFLKRHEQSLMLLVLKLFLLGILTLPKATNFMTLPPRK